MQIPLNDFEQIIDQKILKRGRSYYEDGAITDFTEISTGKYEVIVLGSEEYTVQLETTKNVITQHICDCPYDMGPVCKHIVAAIFYLQRFDLEPGNVNVSSEKKKKKKKKKTKSLSKQLNELLELIPHEELISFIKERSKNDKPFRNSFLASFSHLSENQSKDFYQKQIQAIFRAAGANNDWGWIGRSEMIDLVDSIKPLLENAKKYLSKNSLENAFFISTALLEEAAEVLDYVDDREGYLGYFIESAIEILSLIAEKQTDDTIRKKLLEYCISRFKQGLFKDWDWYLGLLEVARSAIRQEDELDVFFKCLDTIDSEYERERAQVLKLDLLRQFKDEKEVEEYINKHISNDRIRTKEIEGAFAAKNFERVIMLSKDGIKCDEKDKPGLVKGWYDWLLKVAQAQKDVEKIIEYSTFLLIKNFGREQDYYQILKNNIEEDNWFSFLQNLIKKIKQSGTWGAAELIREIYIKEAWWDKLFGLLKQNISLQTIEREEEYLSGNYSSELVELYSVEVEKYLGRFAGRGHYQTVCKYLRRMKKLGGHAKVTKLIELFRKRYPRRPALMDELNQV